jgi:hypothetical protein
MITAVITIFCLALPAALLVGFWLGLFLRVWDAKEGGER